MKSFAITNVYAAMILLLFAACTDYDKYEDNGPQPQTNVYIAGYLDYNNSTAVVWKNGRAIMFPDYEDCRDIAISGNDVYVLGSKRNCVGCLGVNPALTYYWKMAQSQTPTWLGVGAGRTIAVSSNGDVYVGGSTSGKPSSCYWKNGQYVSLCPAGEDFGDVEDIAISGNDVYMAGGVGLAGGAAVWKNGQKVILAEDNDDDYYDATGITVSGNDVYACGYQALYSPFSYHTAIYWKNGQQITLAPNAMANGIVVSGNDVYVCGNTNTDSDTTTAAYWKNGQLITLAQNAQATGIAVHGNDVYVCGYINADSDATTAVYWKNGKQIILGTGKAYAIVIQ